MLSLSIVVVNYNSGKLLRQCIESIRAETTTLDCEILIVDNASTDKSISIAEPSFGEAILIKNTENAGFSKANNIGISKSRGRYVLLVNPDVVVLPGSVVELIRFMEENPTAGIISGKLVNSDRSLQYSIRNFPSLTNQVFEGAFLHHLFPWLTTLVGEVVYNNKAYERERTVDWISGAVMMVRREVFETVGMLDEDFFLYAEEIDWCYRTSKHGWQVSYVPTAQFIHFGSGYRANPALLAQDMRSRRMLYRKHYGLLRAKLLNLIMLSNVVTRAAVYLAAGTVANNKEFKRLWRAHVDGLRQIAVRGEHHAQS